MGFLPLIFNRILFCAACDHRPRKRAMLGLVLLFVIFMGEFHHALCFGNSVHLCDFARAGFAGLLLVGDEIVLESVNEAHGAVGYILPIAEGWVLFHHCDEFIVGLVVVEHPEAADDARGEQDVSVRDGSLRNDAYIDGIAITDDTCAASCLHTALRDSRGAERLGNQAVGERTSVGIRLRAIDHEVARIFVELVLHGVRGYDFNENLHAHGRFVPDVHAVPRMRLEQM